MINLITICETFQKILPGIQNQTVESALFYFLTNLNKVDASHIGEAIQSKIDIIDSYGISKECKKDVKSKLLEINPKMYSDISKFVLGLGKFKSIGCVPNHFIQFSKKATIFASSAFDQLSLTLPGRKFKISILNKCRIRVFGTVFTSIIIESFLHKKAILSLDNFCNHIRDRLKYYKDQFENLIEIQNQYIDKKTIITSLPNKDQIISFFNADFSDNFHFFNHGNEWPDLNSIILNEKYWNVDISDVNINEYNGVYFCMFRKHISQTLIENPNNYGPIKGSYYMDKFMVDFENEVNLLFKENGIQIDFKVNNSKLVNNPKLRDELLSKCCLDYDKFIGLIRPMINSANFQAIQLLKAPLSLFFDENPSYTNHTATIFADAFKKVIIFWKDYDL